MTARSSTTSKGLGSRWRGERGFTLSELLLVSVFVIGLIIVAVNSARGIEAQNRRSNCQTELRNLKMAVAEIHAETGAYPTSTEDVVETGKVELDDVDAWELDSDDPSKSPDYRPVVGSC